MASCPTDTKSCFDWIIAITPIVISLAVACIGFLQYRINKHKFRLDLYNRRFAVYEKALSYFQAYYSNDKANLTVCKQEFIRFYRESVFLFGPNSDVYKALTELKDTLSFFIYFEEKYSVQPYDEDEYKVMSKARNEKRDPHAIMQDLEKALRPWLDFKTIEK